MKDLEGQTSEIIIYNTDDGNANVKLYSKDGVIWMNQQQMGELYQTAKSTLSEHIKNILQEGELVENSVVRNFRTTASDGKNYNVTYYALPMVLAVGFRVRSIRGNRKNRDILEYFFSAYPQRLNNSSVWGFFNFPKHSIPQFFVVNAY